MGNAINEGHELPDYELHDNDEGLYQMNSSQSKLVGNKNVNRILIVDDCGFNVVAI